MSKAQRRWLGAAVTIAAGLALAGSNADRANALAAHCGSHVTKDVTLHANLTGCSGNGLIIAADGVTVDLKGHTIDGSGAFGIDNAQGYDQVTIKSSGRRAKISGFRSDVLIAHGDANVVRNLDASQIDVSHSSGGRLARNQLFRGAFLDRVHQFHVVHNTVSGIFQSDMEVSQSSRITLRENTVLSGNSAIQLVNTEHSRVLSNHVNLGAEPAIWLIHRSDHNVVAGNQIGGSGPGNYGVAVQTSNRNRIAHNYVTDAGLGILIGSDSILGHAFGLGVSHGNVVTQNVIRMGATGIRVAQGSSANTLLDRNTAAFGSQGIRAGDRSTALGGNVVKKNEGHGISAVRGVENLGANVAIRNRGRPQCVHLHCRTVPPGT